MGNLETHKTKQSTKITRKMSNIETTNEVCLISVQKNIRAVEHYLYSLENRSSSETPVHQTG
jgi:undecaprenyl pyrophosphate synthase